jgi:hypothetical protein
LDFLSVQFAATQVCDKRRESLGNCTELVK